MAAKQRWISLDRKLPDYDETVLVITYDDAIHLASRYYTDADGETFLREGFEDLEGEEREHGKVARVKGWRKLPEYLPPLE